MSLLAGKRVLVTGVLTRDSIAYAIAERAQLEGALVLLTSFGRVRRLTERAARGLPATPDVIELDVNCEDDLEALAPAIAERWDALDGAVHAIAHAPADAIGGSFLDASADGAAAAFRTSAFSLGALAGALMPMFERGPGASLVALDFDGSVAWPLYNWMGVAKAALESVGRYLAAELGPRGLRVNLVSPGPLETPAAGAFPGIARMAEQWAECAPLGWDSRDTTVVADPVCFLLSDMARAISGQIVYVDGGFRAVGSRGLANGAGVADPVAV